nr:hypothetical protein [Geodermatophilus sabuli]
MTGQWVRTVAAQREYTVQWRLISLRLLNAHVDYAAQFPPEYEAGHTAGLRLLRVAARTRAEHGPDALGPLYEALGREIHEDPAGGPPPERGGSREFAAQALAAAGLPTEPAAAVDDPSWDADVRADTDAALQLTGKDVGTPILHFRPPDGAAFFGPVISRLPDPEHAVALWDHVVALAAFPGFAELKRSLRERPQLPTSGARPDDVGVVEDWHGGSRRQHR